MAIPSRTVLRSLPPRSLAAGATLVRAGPISERAKALPLIVTAMIPATRQLPILKCLMKRTNFKRRLPFCGFLHTLDPEVNTFGAGNERSMCV